VHDEPSSSTHDFYENVKKITLERHTKKYLSSAGVSCSQLFCACENHNAGASKQHRNQATCSQLQCYVRFS